LSFLEQRLLETELVVLELVSAVHNSHIPTEPYRLSDKDRRLFSDQAQKQPKSAKIEEWKNFPLDTDEHRDTWWRMKYDLVAEAVQGDSYRAVHNSPAQVEPWTDASPASTQYGEPLPQVMGQTHLQSIRSPQMLDIPWPAPPEASTRAHAGTTLSNIDDQPAVDTSPLAFPFSERQPCELSDAPVATSSSFDLPATENWRRKYF
jgi:hypothetical protein